MKVIVLRSILLFDEGNSTEKYPCYLMKVTEKYPDEGNSTEKYPLFDEGNSTEKYPCI